MLLPGDLWLRARALGSADTAVNKIPVCIPHRYSTRERRQSLRRRTSNEYTAVWNTSHREQNVRGESRSAPSPHTATPGSARAPLPRPRRRPTIHTLYQHSLSSRVAAANNVSYVRRTVAPTVPTPRTHVASYIFAKPVTEPPPRQLNHPPTSTPNQPPTPPRAEPRQRSPPYASRSKPPSTPPPSARSRVRTSLAWWG